MICGRKSAHPGELLRSEVVPAMLGEGFTKDGIASALNLSAEEFEEVLAGHHAVTHPLATRLASVVGSSPEFWMRFQAAHDADRG